MSSLLITGGVEVLVSVILIIISIGVLNYFGFLPLSKRFPTLSFLPHKVSDSTPIATIANSNNQSQATGFADQSNLTQIVSPVEPKQFINTNTKFRIFSGFASKIKVIGALHLSFELYSDISQATATDSSLLIFDNGGDYNNDNHRSLRIFHYKNFTI